MSEPSDASTTQLLNVETGDWDDELFARLGLPRDLMPPLVSTGADLGPLDAGLSSHAGLGGARVLACPTHDTASAVAATPLRPGWAYISSGTWSFVGVERTAPMVTSHALDANFTNEGGAFGTVRFLKNVMGLWLLESCRSEWADDGRGMDLADLLSGVCKRHRVRRLRHAGRGPVLQPVAHGRGIQDALRGRRVGAARRPGAADQGHHRLTRAALRLGRRADRARDRAAIEGIHIVGGGSLNDCLSQATADATGRPVAAGPAEATAIGNILVQAVAAGALPSLAPVGSSSPHVSAATLRAEPKGLEGGGAAVPGT